MGIYPLTVKFKNTHTNEAIKKASMFKGKVEFARNLFVFENIMKVADISIHALSPTTVDYLNNKVTPTWTDNVLEENIYNIEAEIFSAEEAGLAEDITNDITKLALSLELNYCQYFRLIDNDEKNRAQLFSNTDMKKQKLVMTKRTFEAKDHPVGSPERNRLNLKSETSEYMPSHLWSVRGLLFNTTCRTKEEAQKWVDKG